MIDMIDRAVFGMAIHIAWVGMEYPAIAISGVHNPCGASPIKPQEAA